MIATKTIILIAFSKISIIIGTVTCKVLKKYPFRQLESAIKTMAGHNNLKAFTVLISLIIYVLKVDENKNIKVAYKHCPQKSKCH